MRSNMNSAIHAITKMHYLTKEAQATMQINTVFCDFVMSVPEEPFVLDTGLDLSAYQSELRRISLAGNIYNIDESNNYFYFDFDNGSGSIFEESFYIPPGIYTIEQIGNNVVAQVEPWLVTVCPHVDPVFFHMTWDPTISKWNYMTMYYGAGATLGCWVSIENESVTSSVIGYAIGMLPCAARFVFNAHHWWNLMNKASLDINEDIVYVCCEDLCTSYQYFSGTDIEEVIGSMNISFDTALNTWEAGSGVPYVYSFDSPRNLSRLRFSFIRYNFRTNRRGPIRGLDIRAMLSFRFSVFFHYLAESKEVQATTSVNTVFVDLAMDVPGTAFTLDTNLDLSTYQSELRRISLAGDIYNIDETNNYFYFDLELLAGGSINKTFHIAPGLYNIEEIGRAFEFLVNDWLLWYCSGSFVLFWDPVISKWNFYTLHTEGTNGLGCWITPMHDSLTSPTIGNALGMLPCAERFVFMKDFSHHLMNKASMDIGEDVIYISCEELCTSFQYFSNTGIEEVIGSMNLSFDTTYNSWEVGSGVPYVYSFDTPHNVSRLMFTFYRYNFRTNRRTHIKATNLRAVLSFRFSVYGHFLHKAVFVNFSLSERFKESGAYNIRTGCDETVYGLRLKQVTLNGASGCNILPGINKFVWKVTSTGTIYVCYVPPCYYTTQGLCTALSAEMNAVLSSGYAWSTAGTEILVKCTINVGQIITELDDSVHTSPYLLSWLSRNPLDSTNLLITVVDSPGYYNWGSIPSQILLIHLLNDRSFSSVGPDYRTTAAMLDLAAGTAAKTTWLDGVTMAAPLLMYESGISISSLRLSITKVDVLTESLVEAIWDARDSYESTMHLVLEVIICVHFLAWMFGGMLLGSILGGAGSAGIAHLIAGKQPVPPKEKVRYVAGTKMGTAVLSGSQSHVEQRANIMLPTTISGYTVNEGGELRALMGGPLLKQVEPMLFPDTITKLSVLSNPYAAGRLNVTMDNPRLDTGPQQITGINTQGIWELFRDLTGHEYIFINAVQLGTTEITGASRKS